MLAVSSSFLRSRLVRSPLRRFAFVALAAAPLAAIPHAYAAEPPSSGILLSTMTSELDRAFHALGHQPGADATKQLPPYFMSYSVADAHQVNIRAEYGALISSADNHARIADVQIRIGSPQLDNTHGTHRASAVKSIVLPLSDDKEAIARSLWYATDIGYGNAIDNYLRVKTEAEVRAKEEDTSPDFSKEPPVVALQQPAPAIVVDRAAWEKRICQLSAIFRE